MDRADADALLADCERLLRPIPTVVSFGAGRHVDIGRPGVSSDYDVALVLGFRDEDGYRAYLDHPRHLELLALWRPKLAGLTIHDVGLDPERRPGD